VWAYRPGTEALRQVEDRLDIIDLVERARLSETQRYAVLAYALHGGSDGPPPRGHPPLGRLAAGPVFRTARWHLRVAARDRAWRDDEWTGAREIALVR
jgi:hypothetical protein